MSHKHRCGSCGHLFEHSDKSFNDEAAHRCPVCKKGPWWYRHYSDDPPFKPKERKVLICLLIAIVIAAAFMALVRAILALPPFIDLAPYGGVIYALIVLIVVIAVINYCYPGHLPRLS